MDESNNMGGGNTTNNQPSQGSDQKVFFDSYNIGRKEKAQYFPGEEGAKKEAKGIAKLFEGKNKFITIAAIAVVVILLVVLILWLTLWRGGNGGDTAFQGGDETNEQLDIPPESVRLKEISDAATYIYNDNIETDDPYRHVQNYLESEATNPDNADIMFSIYMIMSSIYIVNKDYQKDIDYLLGFDLPSMERHNAAKVCKDLALVYTMVGDSEKAGYYTEQQSYYSDLALEEVDDDVQ